MMSAGTRHNRSIIVNTTAMVKFRFSRLRPAERMAAQGAANDELQSLILQSGFLNGAAFGWIALSIRLGLKNDEAPRFQGISKKYSYLGMAIEIDTHEIINADREELKRKYMVAGLKALIGAGKKYNLPTELFEQRLRELQALDQ